MKNREGRNREGKLGRRSILSEFHKGGGGMWVGGGWVGFLSQTWQIGGQRGGPVPNRRKKGHGGKRGGKGSGGGGCVVELDPSSTGTWSGSQTITGN